MWKDKKGAIEQVILVLTIIVGIAFLILLFINFSNVDPEPKCKEVIVKYNETEYFPDNIVYTEEECDKVPLKYTYKQTLTEEYKCIEKNTCIKYKDICIKKNFWGNCVEFEEICDEWTCSKKRVTCYFKIKNIDDEGGTFAFNMVFEEGEKKTNPQTSIRFIRADMEETFSFDYIMEGLVENVGCSITNEQIPIKTVCENVIKNEEVMKNITITKYKTETICE